MGVVTTSFPEHVADPSGRFVHTHVGLWAEQLRASNAGARIEVVAVGKVQTQTSFRDGVVYRVASRGLFDGAGAPEIWEAARGLQRFGVAAEAMRVTLAMAHEVRLRAQNWTHVQSHWLVPSALAVACAAPHVPHTAFVHSGDVAVLESMPGGRALSVWLLARLARVACVSDDLHRRLRTLAGSGWPDRLLVDVHPMPIDEAVFAKPEAVLPPRRGVVGVGRLVPIKGFDMLLFAVGGLPAKLRPLVCLLGEGPQRARLRELGRRLKIDLEMPGVVPPAEVAGALGRAQVCVISSRTLAGGRTEGFPVVAAEALARGAAVIACSVGGLQGLAGRAEVHLVKAGDVQGLRVAIHAVLTGDVRRIGSTLVRKETPNCV